MVAGMSESALFAKCLHTGKNCQNTPPGVNILLPTHKHILQLTVLLSHGTRQGQL